MKQPAPSTTARKAASAKTEAPKTAARTLKTAPGAAAKAPRVASLKERRAQNREQMIATILDSAREIMRESGVHSLSMQQLAKTVGIQAPSLYEYFDSRNAIFDALYELGLQKFHDHIFKDLKKEKDFPGAVRKTFAAVLAFSKKNPDLYQIVFNNALPGYLINDANLLKAKTGLRLGMDILREKFEQGHYDVPIQSEQATLLIDVTLFGIAGRLINFEEAGSGSFRVRYEELVESLISLLTQKSPGAPAKSK